MHQRSFRNAIDCDGKESNEGVGDIREVRPGSISSEGAAAARFFIFRHPHMAEADPPRADQDLSSSHRVPREEASPVQVRAGNPSSLAGRIHVA